jgi:hypothetical protein
VMEVNRLAVTRFRLLPTTRLDPFAFTSLHFPTSPTFNHHLSSNGTAIQRKIEETNSKWRGFVGNDDSLVPDH